MPSLDDYIGFGQNKEIITISSQKAVVSQHEVQSNGNTAIVTQHKNLIPNMISFESPMQNKDIDTLSFVASSQGDHLLLTDTDLDTDESLLDSPGGSSRSSQGLQYQQRRTHSISLDAPRSITCEQGSSIFVKFRLQYLIVHILIMIADGLQGTHLYALYQGYGYSIASLYALGFISGAITSPFIGPIADKIGRKRAAILYCLLEIIINYFEQYPVFTGLILSRIIGGVTTNLLFSVFESWLITEHRKRGFEEKKLEIILRDSTIASNSAAVVSGYFAHCLAAKFGPVGPFQGAVGLTVVALGTVGLLWSENYGKMSKPKESHSWRSNMSEYHGDDTSNSIFSAINMTIILFIDGAYHTILKDSNITRIGIIEGLTEGSLETFVFLWAPALSTYAESASRQTWGISRNGEPEYGLIFGSFMFFGMVGGLLESTTRRAIAHILPGSCKKRRIKKDKDQVGEVNPMSAHILCTICYLMSSILFLTPSLVSKENPFAFNMCFVAFLIYEIMIGLYMPCQGVIRSIYMPNESICSIMTMLRVIVNIVAALGVYSTNLIPFTFVFNVLSIMMASAAILEISFIYSRAAKHQEKAKRN